MTTQTKNTLSTALKIVAIYLILSGINGLLFPLINALIIHWPDYAEFQVRDSAYKFGAYSRIFILNLLYVVSGIGLLLKKPWARKMALIIIAIMTIYSVSDAAWGWARGRPTFRAYCTVSTLILPWKALLFYIVFKTRKLESLGITSMCSQSPPRGSG
jgi:hypothetical protein